MVESALKVGDVAHDLVKRGKVQVVAKAADSVAEHRGREGFDLATYKSHLLLDVAEDEPVFTCVYLPDEPTVSFSGTYDFPRSRLARIPIEEANEDLHRFQTEMVAELLATMFVTATELDADGTLLEVCQATPLPDQLHRDAEQIAEARLLEGSDAE